MLREIVERAIADFEIERRLKRCEEIWSSKVFQLRLYLPSHTLRETSPALHEPQPEQGDSNQVLGLNSQKVEVDTATNGPIKESEQESSQVSQEPNQEASQQELEQEQGTSHASLEQEQGSTLTSRDPEAMTTFPHVSNYLITFVISFLIVAQFLSQPVFGKETILYLFFALCTYNVPRRSYNGDPEHLVPCADIY